MQHTISFFDLRARYVVAGLLVVLILASACSGGLSEPEMLAQAEASFNDGKYSRAVIELKNILQANPQQTDARKLLARSYVMIGDGTSAEKEIDRLTASAEPAADLTLLLLSSWKLQGKHQQILDEYEKGALRDFDRLQVLGIVSNSYINLRQPDKGEALAREMLALDRESVDALIVMAKGASVRDQDDTALEYMDKAITVDPGNQEVWRVKGVIEAKLHDLDQAIESLTKAVTLIQASGSKLNLFMTKVSLIQILLQKGDYEASGRYIEELKAGYKSNPYVNYISGLHAYLLEQYTTAKTELSKVHAVLPNHLPTMLLLGAIHFAENNLEQANLLLTRYVNQVPTHLQARKLLGEIKLRLNKPGETLSLLKSADNQTNDVEILTMIGTAASQSGDYLQGVEYLKRAAKYSPENTRIREELAKLYLRQGAFDEAIAELEKEGSEQSGKRDNLLIISYMKKQDYTAARKISDQVLGRAGPAAEDYYIRALIELSTGHRVDARNYLAKSVEMDAEYIPGLIALARMDLEDGRLSAGSDRLNLVLAKQPDNINAMMLLAQISERSGQQGQALEWLEKAAGLNVKSLLPRAILAKYYLRIKQPEKAAAYLDDTRLRDSGNPAILSLIAELDQQMGRYREAEASIKKIIELNREDEKAYRQLAIIQSKAGDSRAARSTLTEFNKQTPLSTQGKLLLFKLEMKDQRYDKAASIAKQMMANGKTKYTGVLLMATVSEATGKRQMAISLLKQHITPDVPFFLVQKLSDLYVKNGDLESVSALLKNRIQSHQDDQQSKTALAMVYQAHDRVPEAVALYDDLLAADADNIVALNNLALLVFDRDPKRALNLAEKAFNRAGNSSVAVIDTYAWLTHQLGDTGKAIGLLVPILDRTSDPSILYHYAAMLVASGRKGEAKDILGRAFESNNPFPESDEAKLLLSEISTGNG
ncbi:MAG: PEP-CTERM system TPR-repeat protein PrsT [Candidatus Thiodiazotropha sp. (ex Dulcina madagascariensis)]|nr:PEP-CTERM system TPR-repeat protein PrsT [Candidatus Thiodiazotropha sp. (ex Dulcina madagascariensis)]